MERRTFCLESDIYILEHFHSVWSAAFLFRIEEDITLLRNSTLDHIKEYRPKGLLHIRTNPNEEPVIELHAR